MLPLRGILGRAIPVGCAVATLAWFARPAAADEREPAPVRVVVPAAGTRLAREPVRVVGRATVRLADLARAAALRPAPRGPLVPVQIPEGESPLEAIAPATGPAPALPPSVVLATPSPAPGNGFPGLGDVPGAGGQSFIPPDVDGAVGLLQILEGLNNNYQVIDKGTGAVLSTVPITDFWAPAGGSGCFDPRTLYDPIHDRWIVCTLTDGGTAGSGIALGVSQTGDPGGGWYLFRVLADVTGATWADFPTIGFNRNWIAINVNLFRVSGSGYTSSKCLVVDYAQLRSGTLSSTFLTGTGFCSAPVATYSATENTLYCVSHLSSSSPSATYRLDTITGAPASPVYTVGATKSRGTTWVNPSGNLLPQAAPLGGTSSCVGAPCKFEVQDSYVRSTPVLRDGSIYYVQTVGLPAGSLTHTAVQWTRLDAATGAVADGGRIEDATATATNGGKWYAYGHIAANRAGDFIVGYSQFSSAQYASAGYSVHLAGDAAGSIRDARIYQAGLDYYHKDFGSQRNRWGDYSKAQVDPTDDQSLWVLEEYANPRVGTNDGSGANGSRWGTWWANVTGPPPTVGLATGPTIAEGDSGAVTPFPFTVQLSAAYSAPVSVDYATADSTAAAYTDYEPVLDTITIPVGAVSGEVPVTVYGNTLFEPDKYFYPILSHPQRATIGARSAVATIVNDDATTAVGAGNPEREFALGRIVPNPSRGATRVEFAVARAASVTLEIVDLQGRRVALLRSGTLAPGRYAASWNGRDPNGPVAAGVYFVRYAADGHSRMQKLLMLR